MKKKFKFYRCRWNNPLQRMIRIMKLTALFFLAALMHVTASVYSQNKLLTLKEKNIPMESVLKEIEKQSEFFFLYNNKQINDQQKIDIDVTDKLIGDVLKTMLEGTSIHYLIKDRQIVLYQGNDLRSIVDALGGSGDIRQQQPAVSGTVTDENGQPLPGVTVVVKGTTQGTVTNADGEYSLTDLPDDATLVFSFVGMRTQEIEVGDQTSINVTMEVDAIGIEEVVAIGYGVKKKASLTAAISSIKANEIRDIPASSFSDVLAGRLSGVSVQSGTGTPGIPSDIRIRSKSSWNGNTTPVVVIDGVVKDMYSFNALSPSEVEEITVLKDAASAAIYGSRSSNGVLLVTTRSGKIGETSVEFSSTYSMPRIAKMPERMPVADALKLQQIATPGRISDEEINHIVEINPDGLRLFNQLYSDPSGHNHSLTVNGGNDKIRYFIGGSYLREKGFLPKVSFERYNVRGKIDANITKDLNISLNISTNNRQRNKYLAVEMDGNSADMAGGWNQVIDWWPLADPGYIDGKPVGLAGYGSWAELIRNGGYWKNIHRQIDAVFEVNYKIPFIKGLTASSFFSQNSDHGLTKEFGEKSTVYLFERGGEYNQIFTDKLIGPQTNLFPSREYISNEFSRGLSYQFNTQLSYIRTFDKHHINADIIYEQYERDYNYLSGARYDFPLFPKDQFFAGSKDLSDWRNNGYQTEDGRLSGILRIGYEYDNKYLLSTSLRRDGSLKFAPKYRWGNFPSVSAGWVLSEESFFRESKMETWMKFTKLRFSYGSTGNDAIGGWQWQDQFNILSSSYFLGTNGTSVPLLGYGGIPNEKLTWEKSRTYDFGIDLVFKNNIIFSTDVWKRRTSDILGPRILELPVEFGATLPMENYGIIDSKGFELEASYQNKNGNDFSYQISANFGYSTNKVVRQDVATNTQAVDDPNGKPLSYYKGYKIEKMIRTQEELEQIPETMTHFGFKPTLGSYLFKDLSGNDGKPDGKIDGYDRVVLANHIGPNNAPISYGFSFDLSYKNFSFQTTFAGLAGFKIDYQNQWGRNFWPWNIDNVPSWYADSWTADNPDGSFPKVYLTWGGAGYSYTQPSKYSIYDGGFLRNKLMNLSYSFPDRLCRKIGVDRLSVSLLGENLFYISKFKYYDPEVTRSGSYPTMKVFSAGLKVVI